MNREERTEAVVRAWNDGTWYVCPDHIRTGGWESCCSCGGWEPDDSDRGRLCTEELLDRETT